MLIQRPQTPIWKQHNPVAPDPTPSPLSPKRWLEQDSDGAVGLGIVAALHKSIVKTAPVEITPSRPAGCREESHQHGHKTEGLRDEVFFCRSPPISSNKENIVPSANFLSHCSLCRKQMLRKDVYMYQDKAFCNTECRYRQIVNDEMQEKCRRSKMQKTLCSPCSGHGRLFFTRVVEA